jgi:AMMECR1 domain-containing protein
MTARTYRAGWFGTIGLILLLLSLPPVAGEASDAAVPPDRLTTDQQETLHRYVRGLLLAEGGLESDAPAPPDFAVDYNRLYITVYVARKIRACQGSGRGDSFAEDLARAVRRSITDRRFGGPLSSHELEQATLTYDFLHERKTLKRFSPQAVKEGIELGVHAIGIRQGSSRAIFKASVPMKKSYSLKTTLERLSRKAGLPPDSYADPASRIYRFANEAFLGRPDGSVLPLFRGGTLVRPGDVTLDRLGGALALAHDYLDAHLHEGGRGFDYLYFPYRERHSEDNNHIRQMATLWIAIKLGKELRDERLNARLRDMLKRYELLLQRRGEIAYPRVDDRATLGHAAFLLLGLIEMEGYPGRQRLIDELTAGILSLQREDGSFSTSFQSDSSRGQNYYPGEALLALMEVHRLRPDDDLRAAAVKAFEHYSEYWRENRNSAMVPWHSQACRLLYEVERDPAIAAFVFEMNDWLIDRYQVTESPYPDEVGGFRKGTPSTCSSAAYLEGIADACELARASKDTQRAQRYFVSLRSGLRFLLQNQFAEENTYYMPEADSALGGFRRNLVDNRIRIDCVQHAAHAILKALPQERQGPPGGAGAEGEAGEAGGPGTGGGNAGGDGGDEDGDDTDGDGTDGDATDGDDDGPEDDDTGNDLPDPDGDDDDGDGDDDWVDDDDGDDDGDDDLPWPDQDDEEGDGPADDAGFGDDDADGDDDDASEDDGGDDDLPDPGDLGDDDTGDDDTGDDDDGDDDWGDDDGGDDTGDDDSDDDDLPDPGDDDDDAGDDDGGDDDWGDDDSGDDTGDDDWGDDDSGDDTGDDDAGDDDLPDPDDDAGDDDWGDDDEGDDDAGDDDEDDDGDDDEDGGDDEDEDDDGDDDKGPGGRYDRFRYYHWPNDKWSDPGEDSSGEDTDGRWLGMSLPRTSYLWISGEDEEDDDEGPDDDTYHAGDGGEASIFVVCDTDLGDEPDAIEVNDNRIGSLRIAPQYLVHKQYKSRNAYDGGEFWEQAVSRMMTDADQRGPDEFFGAVRELDEDRFPRLDLPPVVYESWGYLEDTDDESGTHGEMLLQNLSYTFWVRVVDGRHTKNDIWQTQRTYTLSWTPSFPADANREDTESAWDNYAGNTDYMPDVVWDALTSLHDYRRNNPAEGGYPSVSKERTAYSEPAPRLFPGGGDRAYYIARPLGEEGMYRSGEARNLPSDTLRVERDNGNQYYTTYLEFEDTGLNRRDAAYARLGLRISDAVDWAGSSHGFSVNNHNDKWYRLYNAVDLDAGDQLLMELNSPHLLRNTNHTRLELWGRGSDAVLIAAGDTNADLKTLLLGYTSQHHNSGGQMSGDGWIDREEDVYDLVDYRLDNRAPNRVRMRVRISDEEWSDSGDGFHIKVNGREIYRDGHAEKGEVRWFDIDPDIFAGESKPRFRFEANGNDGVRIDNGGTYLSVDYY